MCEHLASTTSEGCPYINQVCIILVNSFTIPGSITNGAGFEAQACAFLCFRVCNRIMCSSGVHLLPFLVLAISRASLNSGLSREHVYCHVFPPACVFLSGLGNIPVTEMGGGHPSPMEERSSMWVGVPWVVWPEDASSSIWQTMFSQVIWKVFSTPLDSISTIGTLNASMTCKV